jgi:Fur family ferric uptake transcriptional regulator
MREFVNARKDARFSANDAYCYFMMNGRPISLPTIYRHLDKMTKDGTLRKHRTAESDVAFYSHAGDDAAVNEQTRMKCTSCGRTFPLRCRAAEELARHIGHDHHFFIRLGETVFHGRCEACANA